jgi:hypothetical protein
MHACITVVFMFQSLPVRESHDVSESVEEDTARIDDKDSSRNTPPNTDTDTEYHALHDRLDVFENQLSACEILQK